MNKQAAMKAKLALAGTLAGIPFREIECYGSQIVVTSACDNTARKWARLLSRFATVRGVIKSLDDAKENKGTCLRPSHLPVWRTFAVID